jgi:hypothetical protein
MTGRIAAWLMAALVAAAPGPHAPARLYFPDDPLAVDPETEDASGVKPWNLNGPYDFLENSFFQDADERDAPAANVNTIDEVPDSSWFTNPGPGGTLNPNEVASGGGVSGPTAGAWSVIAAKPSGRSPGFVIRDRAGAEFFVKFVPPSNPEMASAAEIVSTRVLRAVGYHVPDNAIALVRREQITVGEGITLTTEDGRERPFADADIDAILARAAAREDGAYRALVSRRLPGTDLGPFRYAGTRPDDPNDLYAHEHRRELRALRVFAAWLNHDDSRSLNTRDTLVERQGRRLVWHHLLDFGSTLGSGTTQADDPRAGNEYVWESRPTLLTVMTLGLYVRPWIKVKYPDYPAVGHFEADFFQPELWKPNYPNPAFDNARADDVFWAARRLAWFTDDVIAGVVRAAGYSDVAAERYVVDTLIRRRDKILARWLTGVLPLVECAASGDVLSCRNAAVEARVATAPREYRARWHHLDNESGKAEATGDELRAAEPRFALPAALAGARFARVELRADDPAHPEWNAPLTVDLRRSADGRWTTVGVRRID